MNTTNQPHHLSPGEQAIMPLSDRLRHSKALIPVLAVLALTVLALAATLVVNRTEARSGTPAEMAAAQGTAPVMSPAAQATSQQPAVAQASQPAPVRPSSSRPVASTQAPAPAAVCASCGVVESVAAVKRAQQPSGVGAVGGAVVGGLLGNQVGGGNGRAAMTVLGAVGGGYAGNAIEKNMKTVTVYQVRVRMDDGSTRTVERSNPVSTGARVVFDGETMRLA
ncbi:glycine zipper 2TM domain-containing protein [Variovorax sp. VNK109]|jgi:outer membrane lipoprotein SlyB|uniref:glycine zipper 2TM domain-containing protein n=1 Tax=Variovorax sp. VNK109 TaxID=3400919 RepID=UPI003BFE4F9F